jgi:hypothetical protein
MSENEQDDVDVEPRQPPRGIPARDPGIVLSKHWHGVVDRLEEWRAECEKTVTCMRACAYCGKVVYGCRHALHIDTFTHFPAPTDVEFSPAVVENPWLHAHTFSDAEQRHWWRCGPCKSKENSHALRQQLRVKMNNQYASHLVALPIPSEALSMSLLKTIVQLSHRMKGFVQTTPLSTTPYLQGPLVQWHGIPTGHKAIIEPVHDTENRSEDSLHSLQALAEYNLENNPLLKKYHMQVGCSLCITAAIPMCILACLLVHACCCIVLYCTVLYILSCVLTVAVFASSLNYATRKTRTPIPYPSSAQSASTRTCLMQSTET